MILNYITIGALIALQGFDYWSTIKILKHGGKENNKFIKWLMDKVGISNAIVLTKFPVCVGILVLTILFPTFPLWIIWSALFIIQGVLLSLYNLKSLRKIK